MISVLLLCTAFSGPDAPWLSDVAAPPTSRAKLLLSVMTLDEKLALFHGSCLHSGYTGNVCANRRLGVPPIKMNDGPQGFRDSKRRGTTTAWPCALAIAATFSIDAASAWGTAMGAEFFKKGANVQLGPGLNVARVPRNGRNFEYLSGEDPGLGAALVGAVVTGIQSQGVIANAKHYVNNNQETDRTSMSADVSERAQYEIYYVPFKGAVDAGVGSVMCSYNKIRGRWSCENPVTLQLDLKERLGFDGWVMSDWGATHSVSILAGLDQEMPGSNFMGDKLASLVAAGEVPLAKVDDSALRILTKMFAVGIFDVNNTNNITNDVTSAEHNRLARTLATQSIVLLKNDKLLPLPKTKVKLALIGAPAKQPFVSGGGSGVVFPKYVSSPYDAIREAVGLRAGADVCSASDVCVHYDNGTDLSKAAELSATADVALVFAHTTSREGADRGNLSFDGNADELVRAVCKSNPRCAVLGVAPGAVLTPWRSVVAAITLGFMPGQEYGHALADLLFGDAMPTAKLPLTLPKVENEVNLTAAQWPGTGSPRVAHYLEELLIGYRWYDAHDVAPAFPFGFGLSYTTFKLRLLQVSSSKVSLVVANTGSRAGVETVQLYLGFPPSAGEPPLQLKGFRKVAVDVGGVSSVSFELTPRDRSIWDADRHAWSPVSGTFRVLVATSSRDPGSLQGAFTA